VTQAQLNLTFNDAINCSAKAIAWLVGRSTLSNLGSVSSMAARAPGDIGEGSASWGDEDGTIVFLQAACSCTLQNHGADCPDLRGRRMYDETGKTPSKGPRETHSNWVF
jgi:hypothetical protein